MNRALVACALFTAILSSSSGAALALAPPSTPAAARSDQTTSPYDTPHDGRDCPYSDKQIVEGGVLEPRDATQMVGLYPCWAADEDNYKSRDLSDFYAHWSVRQIRGPKTTPRGYHYEARSKILRLFVGRDYSMLSSIKIEMHNPETTIVIPLTHFSYQGRAGKPEFWTTELVGDNQSTPFFRIQPDTSATITLKANATNALEVKAAGTVLDALTSIASIASPGGLVNTLNKDSIQATSRALDNALSNIWSDAQGEEQASGRALSEWYPGARYILKVTMPGWVRPDGYDRSKRKDEQLFVRWYELTLSCPRRSVFNATQECEAGRLGDVETGEDARGTVARAQATAVQSLLNLRQRISAEQVINFKLSSGKKLQEHLASFDWYGRFLRLAGTPEPGKSGTDNGTSAKPTVGALQKENSTDITLSPPPTAGADNPKPVVNETVRTRSDQDYAALCNSIVGELYAVGLSQSDARIGLWAVISASPDFVGTVVNFQKNDTCRSQLPLSGYSDVWWFASTTDTPPPSSSPKPKAPAKPKVVRPR